MINNIYENMIEFNKIKNLWQTYACTAYAKEQIKNMEPYISELELKSKLSETTQSKKLIEICGNPPTVSMDGVEELLDAVKKGQCLSVKELVNIANALTAFSRMKSYLKRGTNYNISIAFYEENIEVMEELRDAITSTISGGFICDNASKYLKSLRFDIENTKDKMTAKAESLLRSHKEYMADSFIVTRNGHVCVPVKTGYKFKIPGSVIDKSASGSTLFIEPVGVAKFYEDLSHLYIDEENEVQRILYELSDMIAEREEAFRNNIKQLEKLDFIFSKGKLSLELDGCVPTIVNERKIRLVDARHPLMDKDICVPLQFEIGGDTRGIVITGPNTGGKTVALKTITLNCMMAGCGLHVTSKEAEICMHSNYLCDIGDGQNISENLSTFSAHIKNVLNILKEVNKDSLIIMDELGSGTDPLEGMGIAISILEELNKSGAFFIVSTHYPEVKVYAEKTKGIVNARMTFDKEKLVPLYQMEIGKAGESQALYIASKLGMPSRMLKRAAKEAYGTADSLANFECLKDSIGNNLSKNANADNDFKLKASRLKKIKSKKTVQAKKFNLGDSVMIYPDKKIGIVCKEVNEKGVLQVMLAGKKIWINHKRVKLHVAADKLYPEDYDFSIIFDSVAKRKARHDMERKYVEGMFEESDSI